MPKYEVTYTRTVVEYITREFVAEDEADAKEQMWSYLDEYDREPDYRKIRDADTYTHKVRD